MAARDDESVGRETHSREATNKSRFVENAFVETSSNRRDVDSWHPIGDRLSVGARGRASRWDRATYRVGVGRQGRVRGVRARVRRPQPVRGRGEPHRRSRRVPVARELGGRGEIGIAAVRRGVRGARHAVRDGSQSLARIHARRGLGGGRRGLGSGDGRGRREVQLVGHRGFRWNRLGLRGTGVGRARARAVGAEEALDVLERTRLLLRLHRVGVCLPHRRRRASCYGAPSEGANASCFNREFEFSGNMMKYVTK